MPLRNTMQRAVIHEAVQALCHHATAEEIYAEVHLLHPSISRATVYRNLNLLVREGLVSRVSVGRGPDRFDAVVEPHYHLHCEICGKIEDVEMEPKHDLERDLRDTHGYRILGHEVVFRGICPECKWLAGRK